jgi:alanine racemase
LRAAGLPPLPRPCWIEVDTDALTANLALVREVVGRGVGVATVVKSDGYGHGIEICARTFAAAGAELICVASFDEALYLRAAGVLAPLFVIFSIPVEALPEAAARDIEVVAADEPGLDAALAAWPAAGSQGTLRMHLEVDTGLSRAGVAPERAGELAARLSGTPGIELAGLWTHLASPDDRATTADQVRRFEQATSAVAAAGLTVPPRHLSASGGIFTSAPSYELVRPGVCLYGELADGLPLSTAGAAAAARLRPAMTLKALPLRVQALAEGRQVGYGGTWRAPRPSVVVTLPVGYGDGYARAYAPGAEVLVRGRRVPVIGTVAMDVTIVDVTDLAGPPVAPDEEFVLLGEQGGERISASELSRLRTTISWEVLASMAWRIPRVYHARAGSTGLRTLAGEDLAR